MALTRGFIRNAVTTPLDARLMDMATIVCNADGTPRTGVLGNANASIVSTTGTMNVNVAAAEFAVSKGKADGVAIFTNDGTVAVAIPAAPGSNSRIDVIWVRHQDSTTGDADSTPIFGVTSGAAAASPVKPGPLPTGAEELATLRVYSGTVATNGGLNVLTNTYRMTAARGGVVSFRTKPDMDAWTTACIGQLASVIAETGANTYRWTGATWAIPTPPVLGSVSVTPTAQGGLTTDTAATGASLAITVPTTGRVKITANVNTYGSTTDVVVALKIKDGATTILQATRQANSSPTAPASTHSHLLMGYVTLTAGAHTISLSVDRAAGTGTFSIVPQTNSPTQIIAEMMD